MALAAGGNLGQISTVFSRRPLFGAVGAHVGMVNAVDAREVVEANCAAQHRTGKADAPHAQVVVYRRHGFQIGDYRPQIGVPEMLVKVGRHDHQGTAVAAHPIPDGPFLIGVAKCGAYAARARGQVGGKDVAAQLTFKEDLPTQIFAMTQAARADHAKNPISNVCPLFFETWRSFSNYFTSRTPVIRPTTKVINIKIRVISIVIFLFPS